MLINTTKKENNIKKINFNQKIEIENNVSYVNQSSLDLVRPLGTGKKPH
jgi:hypothetical protein